MSDVNKNNRKYTLFIVLLFLGTIFIVLKNLRVIDFRNAVEKQADIGKQLAQVHCKRCHEVPDPSLLDKNTWIRSVLPAMAQRFNLEAFHGRYGLTPQSTISVPDFESIQAYYRNMAPEKLVVTRSPSVTDWAIFGVEKPQGISYKPGDEANTVMLAYNPNDQRLYSGDMRNNVYRWGDDLRAEVVATMPSPAVGATFYPPSAGKNQAAFTCIGILNPNDLLKGALTEVDLNSRSEAPVVLADSLPRPVQTISADFNKDGLLDFVTCGFGNNKGSLFLFTQTKDRHFKKSIVRNMPGSEQVFTGDFNNDGYLDMMVLFAQADEGIWMFLNDKQGGFTSKNILHFPPVYGSSSFQLADFNHDGKPDILYTCGDNSDLSPVLKPYHGVYIFTNQGNWTFKQTFFYHIDGSSKAIAADFDKDGDLDIATIAYFPDFKGNPQQGFVYLEQTAANQYKAHEIPVNEYGRWLTMEVADINKDGYPDVILGNFSIAGRELMNQKGVQKSWDKFLPLIVLKNKGSLRH